jgi:hypothetical protein
MTDPAAPVYRLVYVGRSRTAFARLVRRAQRRGIGADLVSALQGMEQRLSADPNAVGESRETYPYLGLKGRVAFFSHFCVRFAVDDVRRLVYVTRFVASGPLR